MQERETVANALDELSDDLHQVTLTDINKETAKDFRFGNGEKKNSVTFSPNNGKQG